MFDFSNFRKYGQDEAVRSIIGLTPSNDEKEAILIYLDIDKSILKEYLFSIIDECLDYRSKESQEYHKKIQRIRNDNPRAYRLKINQFKDKIERDYKFDTSIFKKVVTKSSFEIENIKVMLVEEALNKISTIPNYIFKLLYITDFKSHLTEGMLKWSLNEIVTDEKTKLKNIFRKAENYKKVIDLLIDNEIIEKTKSETFKWIGNKNESGLKKKKLICTLGFILKEKNYLNTDEDASIVRALNGFLIMESLTAQYYGQVRREFDDPERRHNSDYYKFYFFIPNIRV